MSTEIKLTRLSHGTTEQAMTYPRRRFTKAQWEWCLMYHRETTFEPLMCDFVAGNESFVEAARRSTQWFEDWSSDAYLKITAKVPGAMEALRQEIKESA